MFAFRPLKFLFPIIYYLCSIILSYAQNLTTLNYNEGGIPKVEFYQLEGDSLFPLQHLKHAEVTTVVIKLVGGMERVLHNQVLSSKEALIEKSEEGRNVYLVTPINTGNCELVVDVKLMELYYYVTLEQQGKRKVKKINQTYLPRTYMVGFEIVDVID